MKMKEEEGIKEQGVGDKVTRKSGVPEKVARRRRW